jgi:hypothetical protein
MAWVSGFAGCLAAPPVAEAEALITPIAAAWILARTVATSGQGTHLPSFHHGAEFLQIKDLRPLLTPQDSPFVKDNNAGGGFGELPRNFTCRHATCLSLITSVPCSPYAPRCSICPAPTGPGA